MNSRHLPIQKPIPRIQVLRKMIIEEKVPINVIAKEILMICKTTNTELYGFAQIWEDSIMKAAIHLEELIQSGSQSSLPLLGSFWGIKSVICKAGQITSASSKILANYVPCYSADVVQTLEKLGGVSIGATVSDEFAMGSAGDTCADREPAKNPWDQNRVTGGSSSGSAVVVAAGLANIALGSDTGGSVRHPAAVCGIVGFKPTYGTICRNGLIPLASSMDHIGFLSPTVEDVAYILPFLGKKGERDMCAVGLKTTSHLKAPVTIGIASSWYLCADVLPHVYNFMQTMTKTYNWKLQTIDINALKYSAIAYHIICATESLSNMARFDGHLFGNKIEASSYLESSVKSRDKLLGEKVKTRIVSGAYFAQNMAPNTNDSWYELACRARCACNTEIETLFKSVDFYIMPIASSPPRFTNIKMQTNSEELETMDEYEDSYSCIANFGGYPAISIPYSIDKTSHMPIGIQILGPKHSDEWLLEIAKSIEKEICFSNQHEAKVYS